MPLHYFAILEHAYNFFTLSLNIIEIIAVFILVVSGILEMTILFEVLASWFGNPFQKGRFRLLVEDINRPFLDSIRSFLPTPGGLDFSPFIAILILQIVPGIIIGLMGVNYAELISKLQI